MSDFSDDDFGQQLDLDTLLDKLNSSDENSVEEMTLFNKSKTLNISNKKEEKKEQIINPEEEQKENITVWENEFSLINKSTKTKTQMLSILQDFKPAEPLSLKRRNQLKNKISKYLKEFQKVLTLEENNQFIKHLKRKDNIKIIVELIHESFYKLRVNKKFYTLQISDKHSTLENPFYQLNFLDVNILVKFKQKRHISSYLQQIAEFISVKLDDDIQIQNFSFNKKRHVVFQLKNSPININLFLVNEEKEEKFLWHWHEVLITEYSKIDPRFFVIGSFLLYWAHQREILNYQYLTKNNLLYMLIFFLQIQDPPILPPIQELNNLGFSEEPKYKENIKFTTVLQSREKNNQLFTDNSKPNIIERNVQINIFSGKQAQNYLKTQDFNDSSIGILIAQFFNLFGFWIPKFKLQMSIQQGRFILNEKYEPGYILMDPFEKDFCLTRHLTQNIVNRQQETIVNSKYIHLLQEFTRSYDLIQDKKFDKITEKYS